MSVDRATELRRLAKLLHKPESDLDYLQALDGEGLQRLRRLLQDRVLDEFGHLFERMAAAGKLAPDRLSAFLCKKAFGPVLTANMSYYTPTERAVRMSRHFDAEFMAEIAREQMPDRARELLEALPVELMRPVMRILLAEHEYHVMGGFTDYMPEDKVLTLMDEIEDPADNLRVSAYAQRKERIARLTRRLDDATVKAIFDAAFREEALLDEVGLVVAEMPADEQRRHAALTDEVDPSYRERAAARAREQGIADRLSAFLKA